MKSASIVIATLLFISDCSVSSRFIKELDRRNTTIAVLPFNGTGISKTYLDLATDEFTRLIFIKKGFQVIDKSQVKYYLRKIKPDHSILFSKEHYFLLADTLQATVIILGSIELFFIPSEHEENLQHLIITLRFINGANAEIFGMVYEKTTTVLPLSQIIPELLEKMLPKI